MALRMMLSDVQNRLHNLCRQLGEDKMKTKFRCSQLDKCRGATCSDKRAVNFFGGRGAIYSAMMADLGKQPRPQILWNITKKCEANKKNQISITLKTIIVCRISRRYVMLWLVNCWASQSKQPFREGDRLVRGRGSYSPVKWGPIWERFSKARIKKSRRRKKEKKEKECAERTVILWGRSRRVHRREKSQRTKVRKQSF